MESERLLEAEVGGDSNDWMVCQNGAEGFQQTYKELRVPVKERDNL